MPERILKQLNKLHKTGPSAEWLENTRNFLIAKAGQDTLGNELSWSFSFKLNSLMLFKKLMPSPVKVVSFFIIIGLVGGTNMVAQAEYIPKRPLYTVKRTFEKIELVMAVTPQSEAKVNLKHATKRQEEAVKLAQKNDFAPNEKVENISTVVKSLEQNISVAKNNLEIVNNKDENQGQTVELAKEISKNVSENIDVLDNVKETVSRDGIDSAQNVVSEVLDELEKVENTSLQVLIDKVQKNPSSEQTGENILEAVTNNVVSEAEVKEILNKKIERTDKKIKQIEEKVKTSSAENNDLSIETPDSAEAKKAVKVKSEEAQVKLEEVKVLVGEGMLAEALEKVKETNQITRESEVEISKIMDNEIKDQLNAPTSTSSGVIEETEEFNEDVNEQTPEILDLNIDINNYAPLGGKIMQSATSTPTSTNLLNFIGNPVIIENFGEKE